MPAFRSVYVDVLSRKEREGLLRGGTTEPRLIRRISIVLALGEALSLKAVAKPCGCNVKTVELWRDRWIDEGFKGFADAPGRGRNAELIGAREAQIITATQKRPEDETHWSRRRLAKVVGVSK